MVSAITSDLVWSRLLGFLPPDFEALAREFRAFSRARAFDNAAGLLRALLLYVASDFSLKDASALISAEGNGLVASSLHARLCAAEHFLGVLLACTLARGVETQPGRRRLRAIDATCLAGPGATNADLRLHAMADLVTGALVSIRVTGAHIGEASALHPPGSESLVIEDRGYSNAAGLRALDGRGCAYLVRLAPGSLPLFDERGRRLNPGKLAQKALVGKALDMTAWTAERPPRASGKAWAHMVAPERRLPVRLIIVRHDSVQDPIWLVTNLPPGEADANALAGIYRQRWQIELMFKRFKSLGGLDRLRSRNGRSARAWALAKLLLLALAQRLVRPNGPKVDDGLRHSAWSRLRVALAAIRHAVMRTAGLLLATDDTLLARLCESPRHRLRQPLGLSAEPASNLTACA